jgi:hypothetical protein
MGAVQSAVISGATGAINGVYDEVNERCGGHRLYVKRGDASQCIEHFEGKWQVKSVSSKGTDKCIGQVAGGCELRECTSRVWRVSDGKAFHDAPDLKLVTGAEAQRQVRGGYPPFPTSVTSPSTLHTPPIHPSNTPTPPSPPHLPTTPSPCFV